MLGATYEIDLIYLELPAAEISAATHCGGNSRRIPENQPQTEKKRLNQNKNTATPFVFREFPPHSRRFPPHSRRFPPQIGGGGVEKTESKFCRKFQKTPQIRKKCHKSKNAPFVICGINFCRNESLGIYIYIHTYIYIYILYRGGYRSNFARLWLRIATNRHSELLRGLRSL